MAKAKTKSKPSEIHYATGRRKTSSSRVFLKPGKGEISINGKTIAEYFGRKTGQIKVMFPLKVAGVQKVDLYITVSGGGITGKADAIAHGISRVLTLYDETTRPALKSAGLLTRDSREVERKKY